MAWFGKARQARQGLGFGVAWQPGDILILDNILTAHGRNAYTGDRQLLVAMGDMLSYDELDKNLIPNLLMLEE